MSRSRCVFPNTMVVEICYCNDSKCGKKIHELKNDDTDESDDFDNVKTQEKQNQETQDQEYQNDPMDIDEY